MKTLSLLMLLLSYLGIPTPEGDRTKDVSVFVIGKEMLVVGHSSLNAQIDYYLLQKNANAPAQGYLKTESGFTTTVFSEIELRTYLASGELAALGRVVEIPLTNGQHIQYIDKGAVRVIVYKEVSQVYFTEYGGSINKLITKLTAPTGTRQTCEDNCLTRSRQCMSQGRNRVEYCTQKYAECLRTCGSSASAVSINSYSMSI